MRKILNFILTLWFFICIFSFWETFYEVFFVPPKQGTGDIAVMAIPGMAVINFLSLLCTFVQRRWLLPLQSLRFRQIAKVIQWGLLITVGVNVILVGLFLR